MKLKNMLITTSGFLVIAILGVADYITGYEIAFSIFYFIPILACAWLVSRSSAIIASCLSATAWLMADMISGYQYSNLFVPTWNTVMRLGFS